MYARSFRGLSSSKIEGDPLKRAVFGSANHWTSPFQVGSHAWARLFATHDWNVAYISDPITPWHRFGANGERTQEKQKLCAARRTHFENDRVTAWLPYSLLTPQNLPLFRSRWVQDTWHHFSFPSVNQQVCKWGFDAPEVLWLDSVRHRNWGRSLKPQYTVLRVADWSAGFSRVPHSLLEVEHELIAEADLVIASAESLEEKLKPLRGNQPLCTIRNGVDLSFWKQPQPIPQEYRNISAPIAVYVGAVDEWFDTALLHQMAQALPKVSFVMIGNAKRTNETSLAPNIHWLGSRPRKEVPAYLQHAHVGLIPFKRSPLIECVCPLKLYEYMACGLPVIATRWDELERMKSPAKLAANSEEWIGYLQELLSDSPARKPVSENLDYAATNDWQCRWKEWEAHFTSKK
jgi:glycosyltransferase involved in cell wall biosynthesis